MKSHELLRAAWSRQYNAKGGNLQTNPFRKAQLARRLEVSEGTVGRWLAGERLPNLEHATRLAEMLKMDIREYWLARMTEVEERWKEEGR